MGLYIDVYYVSIHTQIPVSLWNRRSVYRYMYMYVYPPTPADGKGGRVREEITSSNCQQLSFRTLLLVRSESNVRQCHVPAASTFRPSLPWHPVLMWRDVRFAGLAAAFWTFLLVRSESNVWLYGLPAAGPSLLPWAMVLWPCRTVL